MSINFKYKIQKRLCFLVTLFFPLLNGEYPFIFHLLTRLDRVNTTTKKNFYYNPIDGNSFVVKLPDPEYLIFRQTCFISNVLQTCSGIFRHVVFLYKDTGKKKRVRYVVVFCLIIVVIKTSEEVIGLRNICN